MDIRVAISDEGSIPSASTFILVDNNQTPTGANWFRRIDDENIREPRHRNPRCLKTIRNSTDAKMRTVRSNVIAFPVFAPKAAVAFAAAA
jgi:hypothetical protein